MADERMFLLAWGKVLQHLAELKLHSVQHIIEHFIRKELHVVSWDLLHLVKVP